MKTKQIGLIALLAIITLALIACKEDEPPPTIQREFNDIVMFSDSGTDYKADIKDARKGAIENTLADLGIVTQIRGAVAEAFNAGNGIVKTRFKNVFGDGDVIITIENNTNYNGYKVGETYNDLRFSFEYLSTVSATDLQTTIITAVKEMFDKIA